MRVKLKPGEQRRFIGEVLRATGWTCAELGQRCGVSKTTIVGWHIERCRMPYDTMQRMASLADLSLPAIEELIDDNERRRKGGRESHRRRKENPELYPNLGVKPILRPDKSPKLAEFIGIMLGDGGIAEYQVTVTLNLKEEMEYAEFVMDLIQELFGLESTLQERPDHGACVVVISSIELIRYLQELGLVQGNKVKLQCGVPEWIFEDREWMKACTRGMMDTDGCVYYHAYKIKGKQYSYIKMTFRGYSYPMVDGLRRMLLAIGYKPGGVRRAGNLSLSSDPAVRYYHEHDIGSNNPHHWRRYWEAVEKTKKTKSE